MQFFAVTPAAGRSSRMGRPKLLMPYCGVPMIAHLLAAWQAAGVRAAVVVRQDDPTLAAICRDAGVKVVLPVSDPPDMKASVREGLARLEQDWQPGDEDYWLLAPADMPLLDAAVIERVAEACREHPGAIVTPTWQGRRGHPAAFPWPLAAEVSKLGPSEGINALLERWPVHEVPMRRREILVDVDTPEDFQQLEAWQDGRPPRKT